VSEQKEEKEIEELLEESLTWNGDGRKSIHNQVWDGNSCPLDW
jgi:hypothetical protein